MTKDDFSRRAEEVLLASTYNILNNLIELSKLYFRDAKSKYGEVPDKDTKLQTITSTLKTQHILEINNLIKEIEKRMRAKTPDEEILNALKEGIKANIYRSSNQ